MGRFHPARFANVRGKCGGLVSDPLDEGVSLFFDGASGETREDRTSVYAVVPGDYYKCRRSESLAGH